LSSNSQTIAKKVALNSLKEMVHSLLLKFSILLKELLTSMVYMDVKVMACREIYDVSMKGGAITSVPPD
jgi:hypothetical protein